MRGNDDSMPLGPGLQGHLVRHPSTIILGLAGEFDIANAPEVERVLRRLERARPAFIVVDVDRLTFVCSRALQTLIAAKLRSLEAGHAFVVRSGDGPAARIMALAGVEELLIGEATPRDGATP